MIRKHSCRANVLKSMAVSLWNQEQKILSRNVLPPAEIVFSSPRSAFHLHSGLVGSACLTRFNLDSVRVERPQERARSGLLGFLTHPPSPGNFTHTDGPTSASLERPGPHSRPRRPNTAPPHVDPGSYPHGTAHTRNGPRPGPPGSAPLHGPARTARPGPPGFAPPNGRPARPDLPRNGSPAPIAHGPSSLSRVTHY